MQQRGLSLAFTAWDACDADCGSGFADRDAYCVDPAGNLADVSACSSYSGKPLLVYMLTLLPAHHCLVHQKPGIYLTHWKACGGNLEDSYG